MSMIYNSSRELAQKMDSEGGLAEFIYGYGLSPEDLPDDMPLEHRAAISTLLGMSRLYEEVQSWLYERMDDPPNPGDYDYQEPEG